MDNFFEVWRGVSYTDPKELLRARAEQTTLDGDEWMAIPVELALKATVVYKQCPAKTVVNGDRFTKTLIEIRCERDLDPATNRHSGSHVNGRITWA